jgi:predicted GIY-YIG superfamily endonuclease
MLGHLNYLDRPTTSIYLSKPLRYIRHDLTADIGYVYMIVSKNKPSLGYVGETISIRRRLYEHNSLQGGSAQTHAGQPWLPAVLIKGFDAPADDPEKWQEINKVNRKEFEKYWRQLNSRFLTWNSVQMMENGRIALREFQKTNPNLDWLQLLELNENGEEQQTFPGNAWSIILT